VAFDPKQLRRWIAALGILILLAVVGFYSYARYKINKQLKQIPAKLGVDVQQSTQGFTFTKSEGGRTLFSISASKAVQYKQGQKAALSDVRIIVYGQTNARSAQGAGQPTYDEIYGQHFEFDPESGDVTAPGEVLIDLQHKGTPPAQPVTGAPSVTRGPDPGTMQVKARGLTFNRKTGIARTDESLEFTLPQARGSARGAVYDSQHLTLTLNTDVRVTLLAQNKPPADLTASHAVIIDRPVRATLSNVHVKQQGRELDAPEMTVNLRDDDTLSNVVASGGVQAHDAGKPQADVRSRQVELTFGQQNQVKNALLTGDVAFNSPGGANGQGAAEGSAGRVLIDFTAKNEISKVRAMQNVKIEQSEAQKSVAPGVKSAPPGSTILADAIDFFITNKTLRRAETSGASSIVLDQAATSPGGKPSRTTVTADKFTAAFARNRLKNLLGSANAKVVSSTPGTPDRVTTSRQISVDLVASGKASSIRSITQEGDFRYAEGGRKASATRAVFSMADETFALTGTPTDTPRIEDGDSGITVTAASIKLNRKTTDASAQGDVKTTYTQLKASPSGAMLASSEPVHVTSATAVLTNNREKARFSGKARLWQGANIVQAPVILFDRTQKTLQASGENESDPQAVQTVFVQTSKAGKQTPMTLTAGRLDYSDSTRRAVFSGGVTAKGSEMTVRGDKMEVFLLARGENSPKSGSASQLDRIVATGNLALDQQNPVRKATGEHLTYTASDGKFVLTGTPGKFPSIFDAEQGNITGDSLTFYTRDDRVQVGSGENSRTVTRTRIKQEIKP
jgi:lipopolysaccharide export system protein LptA